jgi:amidase
MTELCWWSARDLARAIQHRELSGLELVEHFIARIERHNPALNAVVTLDAEGARAAAKEADDASARGAHTGPLHGVPMTVKDSYEVAGMRTTCGASVFRDHVPARDAVAIQRLRAAGAIILGKTNTPPFCADAQTHNAIFGTTKNPWDLAKTPGGSSGGSAAALAAGLTPLELGSDIAGSVRNPAHFCGVFGHKPTHGIVPVRGHIPGKPGDLSVPDLGVVGPFARDADDLALLLNVIAGPADAEAKAYRLQLPAARSHTLRGYRVAAWLDDPAFPIDDAMRAPLEAAVQALRSAGVKVHAGGPPFEFRKLYEAYRQLLDPVMSQGLPEKQLAWLEQVSAGAEPSSPITAFARNAIIRHRDWLEVNEARQQVRAGWARWFEDFDVLLTPVTITTAFAHDHSTPQPQRKLAVSGRERQYDELFAWVSLATFAYLPATAMPIGRTQAGLPVGMQIIGPYLEDRTPLDFAGRLSELLGGFQAPPGY